MASIRSPSKLYWARRASQREYYLQKSAEPVIAEIQSAYELAIDNINNEMQAILRNMPNGDNEAYLYRISRLNDLQEQIYQTLEKTSEIERILTERLYERVMKESYNLTIFHIQKGFGFYYPFSSLPQRTVTEALNAVWLGHNFKTSIWKNTKNLIDEAITIVRAGVLSGAGNWTLVEQLAEKDLSKVASKAKFNAWRLIRTEVNFFTNQGELEAYKESEVEYYDYLATLDHRTSDICTELDSHRYKIEDAKVGENYPPMHPFCRSTTVAVFDSTVKEKLLRRARDPKTKKLYYVSADTSAKEWRKIVAA